MKLSELRAALSSYGIPEADTEARLLFTHCTGLTPAELLGTDPAADDAILLPLLSRRAAREPLAYILGSAPFYRGELAVGEGCLVPRADTERLVELAVSALPRGAHFADLCTGSGAIAVSVLYDRPDTTAVGIDVSEAALAFAEENARRLGVLDRLTLRRADLLRETPEGRFDAILANPPYIPTADLATLAPELAYEPALALDGGEDGLCFYRRLLSFTDALLPGGFFLLECGYDQKDALAALAEERGMSFAPYYDYGKNFRGGLLRPR
ncbi:MAG: peptide chain release factor N(5)-glutamine methyltransferase [Clostridia bacterium]|nr:peptide chain release factor N(5)-glutamine methyltransferase [Clostridia bacterium]